MSPKKKVSRDSFLSHLVQDVLFELYPAPSNIPLREELALPWDFLLNIQVPPRQRRNTNMRAGRNLIRSAPDIRFIANWELAGTLKGKLNYRLYRRNNLPQPRLVQNWLPSRVVFFVPNYIPLQALERIPEFRIIPGPRTAIQIPFTYLMRYLPAYFHGLTPEQKRAVLPRILVAIGMRIFSELRQ